MDMKRFFLYAIVITALALAGCGGGGGTSLMVEGQRATQDLINQLISDRNAAQSERDAADTTLGAVASALGLMGDPTQMDYTEAIMALQEEDPTLVAVRDELDLDATADQAAIIAAIDALQMTQMPPVEDPASVAISGAIADPDGDGMPTGGLMKSERPNVAGGPSDRVTQGTDVGMHHIRADAGSVSRPTALRVSTDTAAEAPGWRGTPTVTAANAGDTLNKDDMTGTTPNQRSVANQFMLASYGVPTRGGFTGEVHERTVEKVTDKLKIYTNIDDPKAVAYDDYYANTAGTPDIGTAANRVGVNGATPEGVLTLTPFDATDATSIANTSFDSDLYGGSGFPTANNSFKTLSNTDVADTSAKENEISGMFNGVPGKFTCTGGSACVATKDDMGRIRLTGGTLTFTPDGDDITKIMIPGVSHDADYLAFGYWVQITEQADGTMKHAIQTFATGSQPYTLVNAQRPALTGRATYNGAAAGQFVRKEGAIGSAVATSSGHFTAAARLTATFGQTTGTNAGSLAPNELYSIDGTVSDFTDGAGNEIDAAWSVGLMKAGFAASGATHNVTASGLPTNTFGGDTTGGGSWEGRFFGPATNASNEEAVTPTGVAGEFNAHFGNGHVVGAFGAAR